MKTWEKVTLGAMAVTGVVLVATSSPKQTRFSLSDLVALARRAGFPDPELAAAVAMAESGGNALAVGDNGTSFGLWQIHTPAHPEYSPSSLLDARNNAAAALAISSHGANWKPWSTFNSGAYARYYRTA